MTVASIGNSVNDVIIEDRSGAAFGRERSFVVTPDAAMAREVTDALVEVGVPDRGQAFAEPVSPEIVRLGLDADADDLVTVMRYAKPDDEAAGERWREELPMAVLRVRDPDAARAVEPFPAPVYTDKSATDERRFEDDLGDLVDAVEEAWGQPVATEGAFSSLQLDVDLIGQDCLLRPMNCLGDTQDADYQISPEASLDEGQVLAVVGTLGTATGNATYVSISVNRADVLEGVVNVTDDDLEDSARPFARTVDNTDRLYVHYFARECGDLQPCVEITTDRVPVGETIRLIQRNYVRPGTTTGPDPTLLVDPILVTLDAAELP